ncbi:MAG: hypothetical protein ACKO96_03940, partial [Flammeovirgaceae bacterium]
MFTVVLWSPTIAKFSHLPDRCTHYKQQLELSQCQTPTLYGSFTGWHGEPMHDLVTMMRDNDKRPPNFIKMLNDQGKSQVT